MVLLDIYEINRRATHNLDKDFALSTSNNKVNLHLTTDFEKQFPNFKWQDIGFNNKYAYNNINFDVYLYDVNNYQVPEQETSKEKIKNDILKESANNQCYNTKDSKDFFEDVKKSENLRQINAIHISLQNNLENLSHTFEQCKSPQEMKIYKKALIGLLSGEHPEPLSGSVLNKNQVSFWSRITAGKAWNQQQKDYSEKQAQRFNELTSYLTANPYFNEIKNSMLQDLVKGDSLGGTINKLNEMQKENISQSKTLEKNLQNKYQTNNFDRYRYDNAQDYGRKLIIEAANADIIKQAYKQVDEKIATQEAKKAAEIAAEKASQKIIVDTNKQRIIEERANHNQNKTSGVVEADSNAQIKVNAAKEKLASRLANSEEKNKNEVLENIKKQGFEKKDITNIIKQQKQSRK